jgi:acyl transferase domain-containing protein
LLIGAKSEGELSQRLRAIHDEAQADHAPAPAPPPENDLRMPLRLAIDYGDAAELAEKSGKALKALASNNRSAWKMLRNQGVFLGRDAAPKVAFLYTGQGSQYVNMLRSLRNDEPVVAGTFAEADRVMAPLLGKPLTDFIFVDESDEAQVAKAEEALRQTAITQPAVLAIDIALTRLFAAYGILPDMVMGHSLGEYGALVAAGSFSFAEALVAVSQRGTEMTRVSVADNGLMAAVS